MRMDKWMNVLNAQDVTSTQPSFVDQRLLLVVQIDFKTSDFSIKFNSIWFDLIWFDLIRFNSIQLNSIQ